MAKQDNIRDIFIKGRVMWAKILEPQSSPKSRGKKSYKVDIEVSDKLIAGLKKAGVKIGEGQYDKKIREVDGVKYLIGVKRSEKTSKGNVAKKLPVINRAGQPVTQLVGHGSVCKIKVALIPVDGQTLMYLKAVQVLEHVIYEGGSGDDLDGFDIEKDDDLDGFGSTSSSDVADVPFSTDADDDLI